MNQEKFLLAVKEDQDLPWQLNVMADALIKGRIYHWASGKFGECLKGTFTKWDLDETGHSYGGHFVDVKRYNKNGEIIKEYEKYFDNPDTFFAEIKQNPGNPFEIMNF